MIAGRVRGLPLTERDVGLNLVFCDSALRRHGSTLRLGKWPA